MTASTPPALVRTSKTLRDIASSLLVNELFLTYYRRAFREPETSQSTADRLRLFPQHLQSHRPFATMRMHFHNGRVSNSITGVGQPRPGWSPCGGLAVARTGDGRACQ